MVGVVLTSLTLVGCQIVPDREDVLPVSAVHVDNVQVTLLEQGADGARFSVAVTLTNTNKFDMVMPLAGCTLHIDGFEPYEFESIPPAALIADDTQTIVLYAAVATNGADAQGRPFRVSGYFKYRPPGEIKAVIHEIGMPLPSANFKTQGRVQG